MKDFDLVEQFQLERQKESTPSDVADLRDFFRERHANNYKIADALDCRPQQISMWFNGHQSTPNKWKIELEKLRDRFVEWEKIHGRVFNSDAHLLTINTPISKCPYYKDYDIRFGIDFDQYDVCEKCDLKSNCKEFHSKYLLTNTEE